MNDLFQRFMTERLRCALQGRLNVLAEPRHHLDLTRKIDLAPDLEFVRGGKCVAVGDLKYKIYTDGKGRNPDYYQLLAYTTALELSEGALIYCGTDQADRPSTKVVRHANKRLHTWAVDLTASAASVDTEIAALADWIVEGPVCSPGTSGPSSSSGTDSHPRRTGVTPAASRSLTLTVVGSAHCRITSNTVE